MFLPFASPTVRESKIEAYLRRRVIEAGGECWKFTSPGLIGVPDRTVFMPGGKVYLCELKAEGEALKSAQERRAARLTELGVSVYKIDSMDAVDYFMAVIS